MEVEPRLHPLRLRNVEVELRLHLPTLRSVEVEPRLRLPTLRNMEGMKGKKGVNVEVNFECGKSGMKAWMKGETC